MTAVEIARLFSFVRETGQNDGPWVRAFQEVTGNKKGDSWCASFASAVLVIAGGGKSPLPVTASCDVILEAAKKNGWLSDVPRVGDLYLYLNSPTDAHHVGIVADVNVSGFVGISGNTSADGLSSNGDRVAERPLSLRPGKTVFVRYPR